MYNDLPGAAADKQTYRLISRYHGNQVFLALEVCTAVQSQKAVSAYFTSEQILPFGFAEQYTSTPIWLSQRLLVTP